LAEVFFSDLLRLTVAARTDIIYVSGGADMETIIRRLNEEEYRFLGDFLYEAIFIPEGVEPPPRDIIEKPELRLYTEDFGSSPHDIAFGAFRGGSIVGAVWCRIMKDYGHVDDLTLSLAISLYREFRGKGLGTALMRAILNELRSRGYRQVSLAVQKENYAVKLYRSLGFETVSENTEEFIMIKKLTEDI
jgi:ribosomal protein S18 acetylase RimI-like enzyme